MCTVSVGEQQKEAFHYLCEILKETGVTLIDNINMKFDFKMWNLTKNEFESAINDYLSTLGETTNIKTLSDIIAYNEAHIETALKYGQSTFNYIKNDNSSTFTGTEYMHFLEEREKIIYDFDRVFDQYGIDVILCETFNKDIAQFTCFQVWAFLLVNERTNTQLTVISWHVGLMKRHLFKLLQ